MSLEYEELQQILSTSYSKKPPWGSLMLARVEYTYYSSMPGHEGELVARVSSLESPMVFEEVYVSQPLLSNHAIIASMLIKGCGVVVGWLSNARPIIIACIPLSYKRSSEDQDLPTPDTKYGYNNVEDLDRFKDGEWKQGEMIIQSAVIDTSSAKKVQPGPRVIFDRYGSIRVQQEWKTYKAGEIGRPASAATREAYVEARIGLGYLSESAYPSNPIKDDQFNENVKVELIIYDSARVVLYKQQITAEGSVNLFVKSKYFAEIQNEAEFVLGKGMTITVADDVELASSKSIKISATQDLELNGALVKTNGSTHFACGLPTSGPHLCPIFGTPSLIVASATVKQGG